MIKEWRWFPYLSYGKLTEHEAMLLGLDSSLENKALVFQWLDHVFVVGVVSDEEA